MARNHNYHFSFYGVFFLLIISFVDGAIQNKNKLLFFFDKVEVFGDLDVFIKKGDKRGKVSIFADSQIIDDVVTDVRNKTLRLDANNSFSFGRRIPFVRVDAVRKFPVEIIVSVSELSELHLFDQSNLTCSGIEGSELKIFHAGSGNLYLENNLISKVRTHQTGNGSIYLKGEHTVELESEIEGYGDMDAGEFKVDSVKIFHRGTGTAHLNSKEWVDARIFSSGSILLHQNPNKMVVDQKGTGKINSLLEEL